MLPGLLPWLHTVVDRRAILWLDRRVLTYVEEVVPHIRAATTVQSEHVGNGRPGRDFVADT